MIRKTSLDIWINVWKNMNHPDRFLILYDNQIPFNDSPTSNLQWKLYFSFYVMNPMIRPFPDGTQLFVAIHSLGYPYNLVEVRSPWDNFEVDEIPPGGSLPFHNKGTYFVAYNVNYDNKMYKIPLQDVNIYSTKKIIYH